MGAIELSNGKVRTMFEVRINKDPESQLWDSGKPLGWVVTVDGDFPFFSVDEQRDIVITIKAEDARLER
jgi:hypothetical protein